MVLINPHDEKGEERGTYIKIVAKVDIVLDKDVTIHKENSVVTVQEGCLEEITEWWEHMAVFNGNLEYTEVSKFEHDRYHQCRIDQEVRNTKLQIHAVETGMNVDGREVSEELINSFCFDLGGASFEPDSHVANLVNTHADLMLSQINGKIISTDKDKENWQGFIDEFFGDDFPLMTIENLTRFK